MGFPCISKTAMSVNTGQKLIKRKYGYIMNGYLFITKEQWNEVLLTIFSSYAQNEKYFQHTFIKKITA